MKKLGKFLGVYATINTTSQTTARGVNEGNIAYVRASVPSAMSPGDKLAITVPPGQDPSLIPSGQFFPSLYNTGTGVQNYGSALAIVSHDVSQGITTLQTQSGISAGAQVLLEYIGVQ